MTTSRVLIDPRPTLAVAPWSILTTLRALLSQLRNYVIARRQSIVAVRRSLLNALAV
jgi:hypothetical protein